MKATHSTMVLVRSSPLRNKSTLDVWLGTATTSVSPARPGSTLTLRRSALPFRVSAIPGTRMVPALLAMEGTFWTLLEIAFSTLLPSLLPVIRSARPGMLIDVLPVQIWPTLMLMVSARP